MNNLLSKKGKDLLLLSMSTVFCAYNIVLWRQNPHLCNRTDKIMIIKSRDYIKNILNRIFK